MKIVSKQMQYYYSHKEACNKRYREWAVKNREKLRLSRKLYRATEGGREATRRAIRNYEARNPKRRRAWDVARKLELEPCVKCGATPSHKHHPDINKPLEVIYLCPLHHKAEHAKANNIVVK